jgi:serine/threonine protein kinase
VVVKQYKHALYQVEPERLFREIDFLKSLSHERIPSYLGHYVAEVQGRPLLHLVVEYIDGESLAVIQREHRWSVSEISSIVLQMLEVVDYLHSLQPPVLHRDIKPTNLMLQADTQKEWQVHLIDFGTAMDSIHLSMGATQNVGTIGYTPLEQIQGFPSMASDVYSMGVVTWELLTRCRAKDYLRGPLLQWQEPAQDLPEYLRCWLSKMLAEESERYQSAGEALIDLMRLSTPEQVLPISVRRTVSWTEEASRTWMLLVSRTSGAPRERALEWWRQFESHQHSNQLPGLFLVIRSILLKRPRFRIVEYIQDLVMNSSNGTQIWTEYSSSCERIASIDSEMEGLSGWHWFKGHKLQKERSDLVNRVRALQRVLETACEPWLEFVGRCSSETLGLLNSTREVDASPHRSHLYNLSASSLEMIEVSDDVTHLMISSTSITQEMYEEVTGVNPSVDIKQLHPVESVSWLDAVLFCNRLSQRFGLNPVYEVINATSRAPIVHVLPTDGFCLPTWQEWHYVARAKTLYRYAGSDEAHLVGWVNLVRSGHQRCALLRPNDFGLYDMTGNVAEWCEDRSPNSAMERLIAGGSFRDGLEWVQVGAHYFEPWNMTSFDLGFRVARRLAGPSEL